MAASLFGDQVGATLVTTLYARAHAHLSGANVRFDDVQAREVWARLEEHARLAGEPSPTELAVTEHANVLGTIRRSLAIDRATWQFVLERPGAQVVTLGIGLCNRRSRLARLDAEFIGVDRAAVVRLRRELIPDDTTTLIAGSVVDSAWLTKIEPDRPTLVIAEGLLMYLSPEHVSDLLERIGDHFGHGTQVFADVFHPMAAQFGHPINATTGARFHSAQAGASGLAAMSPGWRAVADVDIMRNSGFLPAQWNAAFQLLSGRSMYTVAEIEFRQPH